MNLGMFIIQFLVLMTVVCGTLIFFLKKLLFDSTQGAVNRLNRFVVVVTTRPSAAKHSSSRHFPTEHCPSTIRTPQ